MFYSMLYFSNVPQFAIGLQSPSSTTQNDKIPFYNIKDLEKSKSISFLKKNVSFTIGVQHVHSPLTFVLPSPSCDGRVHMLCTCSALPFF